MITEPSTTKWAYTDSSTLTYSITRHTTGGILQCKATNLAVFFFFLLVCLFFHCYQYGLWIWCLFTWSLVAWSKWIQTLYVCYLTSSWCRFLCWEQDHRIYKLQNIFWYPPPLVWIWGGGYIGIALSGWNLSICSSVRVSNGVRPVSPELLNHFLPNLVWWCIIMRRCVLQKNWFTIFNVKVTVRAYIIKILLFLLYLLNCWSVCNQTWCGSTAS